MSALAAPPVSPFRGLAAFADTELDALFFFGREREREVLVANLLASRLTVLYGESGVGKSSLLGAAVVRDLRDAAPGASVVLHGSWSVPVDVLDELAGVDEGYLLLDQFEEYFLYHAEEDGPGVLLHDLPELLRSSRVNVLISLREDALARLDAFKARIPSIFANQVRLEHLGRSEARSAILGPLGRWTELTGEHVDAEPELVEAVLDETRASGSERIEAPYLQLVLERIWQAERDADSRVLRRETLRRLGGAATIVRDHLHVALESLEPEEQDVAASMFEHLVTPSGTKIAHRAPDLAEYARVPEPTLRRVLSRLSGDRILTSVEGSDRFEIFHDVLAEPISAWRLQRRLEQERAAARTRQRRLVAVAVAAVIALGIVAGLAVWAFSERGTARSQAEQARAGEYEAQSLQQLDVDPNRGLELALRAVRLEPDGVAASVLQRALVADRLRLSVHVHAPITAVAVSPDRRLIATGLAHRRVLLLSSATRRVERTLRTSGPVGAVAFSSDGGKVIAARATGRADLFDAATGDVIRRGATAGRLPNGSLALVPLRGALRRLDTHVQRLAVSPDGQRLAAAIADPESRVRVSLFTRGGKLVRRLPGIGIRDLSFSPDGRLLATAAANGDTVLWNARSGVRVRILAESTHGANALAFSPSGALLATAGRDDAVRVFSIAKPDPVFRLFQHKNPIATVAWSPDGQVLASGSYDDTAVLWRVQTTVGSGSLAAIYAGATAAVTSLAFTSDGAHVVTGGADAVARVWDAQPDQQLTLLAHAPGSALAARWAGSRIVALWSSGALVTFDAATRRRQQVLQAPGRVEATALGVSPDAAVVAAGAADGSVTAWDGRTGRKLWGRFGLPPVSALTVSPDADEIVVGGGRALHAYQASTGKERWRATAPGAVRSLAVSPSGDAVVAAGAGGAVVLDARNGTQLHVLRGAATTAVYSPDGSRIAAAGTDGVLRIWLARTGALERSRRAGTKPLTGVAFSGTSGTVATSGADSDAHAWEVQTGKGLVLQRASSGPLQAIGLDASGEWAVGAAPTSAIIWNTTNGTMLAYLRGHDSLVTSVSFAPTTPTVLTSSRDGTVRTYACDVCVDLAGLVRLAEQRLAQTR